MKSTILLATTLFLISAPAPDSDDIAEMTSNFIVPENVPGLMAADQAPGRNALETELPNATSANMSGPGSADIPPDVDESGLLEDDRQGS